MRKEKSTVEYLSNIQWVDKDKTNDTYYMNFVHDPFSLEIMKKLINDRRINYNMTPIQKAEMQAAAGHCSFAYKDDYPWGTVIVDGEQKVVCKCLKFDCKLFNECRKGISAFDDSEIIDNENNAVLTERDLIDEYLQKGNDYKKEFLGVDEYKPVIDNSENYIDIMDEDHTHSSGSIHIVDAAPRLEENILVSENEASQEENVNENVLSDFRDWLEKNKYEDIEDTIRRIEKINSFANKKAIWKKDIYSADIIELGTDYFNLQIDTLTQSQFYKDSMALYISALRAMETFISDMTKGEENDTDNAVELQDDDFEITYEQNETLEEIIEEPKERFEKFEVIDQNSVITADVEERIIINAGPGTGKTYTLIPEEIMVLCFSRAAVDVVETRLKRAAADGRVGMQWHLIDIRTFDSFATSLLAYVAENEKHILYKDFVLDSLDYDGRINAAIEVLKKEKKLIEQCKHLIVDEVQDLVKVKESFSSKIINLIKEFFKFNKK